MPDMESLNRAVEEARWERMEESPDYVVWRKRWAEGYSESSAVPKAIEAAIRAPLEAEVERLREALRPLVAAYDGGDLECPHFHFCPAHRDRVRNGGPCNCGAGEIEAAIEKARALATPPSSTEGDGTQVPD